MFGGSDTEERWIGRILQQMNAGKSIGSILLECGSWTERAKILLNIKKIEKCFDTFKKQVSSGDAVPT